MSYAEIETAAYNLIQKYRDYGFDLAEPDTFGYVHEVKHANRQSGGTWFGKDEMRIFSTQDIRLHGGCVLTFSDRNFDGSGREHKVALLERNGGVVSVIDPKFENADQARRFARVLVRHLRGLGDEPKKRLRPLPDPHHFRLTERCSLVVNVTDEGVIFDAYMGEEHLGTRAMTASEWFDAITGGAR